jgi:alginate O-acetyltransferase complex protein AlgI
VLFNSILFLFAFLPITYAVFWILKTRTRRYVWLTLTSYVFYGWWNYRFCALMFLSTGISYVAGRGLLRWEDPKRRRLCLACPIIADLLLLGFFKYANFAIDSVVGAFRWGGIETAHPHLNIVLPVGISFYTFHTISYVVDSYRGVIRPTRDFFKFSCYVSLFSQLVAGPIVRFAEIERDLDQIDRRDRRTTLDLGWSFLAIGLSKKLLIADTIAAIINPALERYALLSTTGAWCCALGYSYQLYFDFSGYSDMAVGLGHLFGLRIPQNFDSPYKADSPADFWRRWHISLSTCLRDYLYIPMGGNRGAAWNTYRNLLLTMLLGGLWHGASWTFVFWGGYHGVLLCAHRAYRHRWSTVPSVLRRAATFFAVVIGWVFFRSTSFGMALALLRAMFSPVSGESVATAAALAVVVGTAAAIAHCLPNCFEMKHDWAWWQTAALAALFATCLVLMYGSHASPFLYYQF